VVFLRPSLDLEESKKLTESMASMFTQIHGGEFETNILNSDFYSNKGDI